MYAMSIYVCVCAREQIGVHTNSVPRHTLSVYPRSGSLGYPPSGYDSASVRTRLQLSMRGSATHTIVALFCVCAILVTAASAYAGVSPVRLADIKALTFRAGEYADRVRSVNQPTMQCTKGAACSSDRAYYPTTALCENKGTDGIRAQWRCEFPELHHSVKIPEFTVRCEGWSYPGDPMVRPGSCILDYTLEWAPLKVDTYPVRSVGCILIELYTSSYTLL